jgi:16S rRNA pseudouridine516 synthase
MCAFLRQRKKERTKRCSLKFLSHKKRRALKKTNFAHRTPLFKCHLLSSDSLVEKSKRVWEGVYFTWYGRVRAREREVQTNQRASSNSPSFFFLAFGEVKKPIKYVRAFGLCRCVTAAQAFYFLTNFFVSQIFAEKKQKRALSPRHAGVCVWGGEIIMLATTRYLFYERNHLVCRRCVQREDARAVRGERRGRRRGGVFFASKAPPSSPPPPRGRKKERVDRLLSRLGYCDARSKVKSEFLNTNRLALASSPSTEIKSPSEKVDPSDVLIDGRSLEDNELDGVLILFHKPKNCVCSKEKDEGNNVYDELMKATLAMNSNSNSDEFKNDGNGKERIERWLNRVPEINTVGRLDKDTTGVLLFTDDGKLLHAYTSKKVEKVYEVTCDKAIPSEAIPLFASGTIKLSGEPKACLPAKLEIDETNAAKATITLSEGKFHQVKKMFFEGLGCTVTDLHRSSFAGFVLKDGFGPGMCEQLDITEARKAFNL